MTGEPIDELITGFQDLGKELNDLALKDDSVYTHVGEILRTLKTHQKNITEQKTEAFGDAKERVAEVTEQFKHVLAALSACEEAGKRRVVQFLDRSERHRLGAAQTGQDIPAPPPALVGISVRESWDFEVINSGLLPTYYLTPDLKKIGAYLKAADPPAPIPGVQFFRKKILAVKAL